MNLPAQNRVRSTCVHSTQALVIVGRESKWKLPRLIVVRTLAHYPLMKTRQHCDICSRAEYQDVRTHIYFTPSQHSMGYEVYLSIDSIGLDSKEARRGYVAIP